jgi:type I restriction-modification system DNA methylase subunit
MEVLQRFGRKSSAFKSFMDIPFSDIETHSEFQYALEVWTKFGQVAYGDIIGALVKRRKIRKTGSAEIQTKNDVFLLVSYYSFVVHSLLDALCMKLGITYQIISFDNQMDAQETALDYIFPHNWMEISDSSVLEVKETILHQVKSLVAVLDDLEKNDLLKPLFEDIFPRPLRRLLGEYYTPKYLAESILENLPTNGLAEKIVLDPACGSGLFLMECIRRKKRNFELQGLHPSVILNKITNSVFGIDISPIAVVAARFNYILAVKELLLEKKQDCINIPVYLADSIQVSGINDEIGADRFLEPLFGNIDVLIGNPPWISWGNLTEDLKQKWKEKYVEDYNLLQYSGKHARLGHSNDDISVPFAWVSMDKYLKKEGIAGFVLKRTLLKGPSGKLFRSMKISRANLEDREIKVHLVQDWGEFEPFGKGIGAETSTVVMQLDSPSSFPIKYTLWKPSADNVLTPDSRLRDITKSLKIHQKLLIPLDDSPEAPWVESGLDVSAIGTCIHEIRHGAKDDLKSVFEISRSKIEELESDLIYPYLKSRDIVRWGTLSYSYRLIPQKKSGENNEGLIKKKFPLTYNYLLDNRLDLEIRKSTWLKTGTFYSVFGVGEYTWSKYKVTWCRLGFRPEFCVISTKNDPILGEKMLIPGDHFMFIPFDTEKEAHSICALLNSTQYTKTLGEISHKSKSALSKQVVSSLLLPEFSSISSGEKLASLSLQAHELVEQAIRSGTPSSRREYGEPKKLEKIQFSIDSIVSDFLQN